MLERYAHTDLALESCNGRAPDLAGVENHAETGAVGCLHRIAIRTAEAAVALGKPIGTYVTLECGEIHRLDSETAMRVAETLTAELLTLTREVTGRLPGSEMSVLVVGLGNAHLTADAIGPETARRLTATRHLAERDADLFRALGCTSLSVVMPGVLGETGIESLELLRGAVDAVHPDLVIAVDALAAQSCARLAATVQLSDSGIVPGSGVGNRRTAITAETLGVPVISLGVPTVVDSATLVWDALREAGVEEVDERLHTVLETGRSFFVSPKDSDLITEAVADLLARAISDAYGGIPL